MMLLPLRNQRPLRPIFVHLQDPGGSSQMLQVRTPGALVLVRGLCSAVRPDAAVVFIAAAAGAPSVKLPASPADAAFRASFSFAESARCFWAAATGLTPVGADAAAVAAFPANRTNCRYLSNNCWHFSKSRSVAVIPDTSASSAWLTREPRFLATASPL